MSISTLGVANEMRTQFAIQIHIRYEYIHLSHSSVPRIQKHSCHAPLAPGLPVKCGVAAFNSSSASTVSAEKLHLFLNNLIQIQLLQFFWGMLSKSSSSGASMTCETRVYNTSAGGQINSHAANAPRQRPGTHRENNSPCSSFCVVSLHYNQYFRKTEGGKKKVFKEMEKS